MFQEDKTSFEDVVIQTMEMLNFAVVPRNPTNNVQQDNISFECDGGNSKQSDENRSVSDLLNNLECNSTEGNNGENEVEKLREELQVEANMKALAEAKLVKLMEYIGLLHSEFGKLITNILSMTKESCVSNNLSNLGPFSSKSVRDDFFKQFGELIAHFYNVKVDDFYETIDSLNNLNKLLENSKINCGNCNNNDLSNKSNEFGRRACHLNFDPEQNLALENSEISQGYMRQPDSSPLPPPLPSDIADISEQNITTNNASVMQSNNESFLSQLLSSSTVPSSSPSIRNSVVQHRFVHSDRDPLHFYCSWVAKFSRNNFISLSDHIRLSTTLNSDHRVIQKHLRSGMEKISAPLWKCAHCQELFDRRPTYLQHCKTVHNTETEESLLQSLLLE